MFVSSPLEHIANFLFQYKINYHELLCCAINVRNAG